MSLGQAQQAAGIRFDGSGDGAHYPTKLPSGFAYLFVDTFTRDAVGCVGAELGRASIPRDTITTPEGFRLGETVRRLQAVYGTRLRHVPEPPSGIEPRDGYVVAEGGGWLAFSTSRTGLVWGISGGRNGFDRQPLTPSTCIG